MIGQDRPQRGVSRQGAIIVGGLAIIILAVGVAIALGVGPAVPVPATAPSGIDAVASPASSDLALVNVAPIAIQGPTTYPQGVSSFPASPSLTPTSTGQIRANRIRIASVGIDLAIIDGDGIDAPIGKAAHYPGSAWPGGGSNIYIYGHARVGMFIALWQVRVGDTVELDLVDGTSRTYVVTKVLPKVPYNAVTYLRPTNTEQLTLQTSTSYYPTAPRFVVIAVPQS